MNVYYLSAKPSTSNYLKNMLLSKKKVRRISLPRKKESSNNKMDFSYLESIFACSSPAKAYVKHTKSAKSVLTDYFSKLKLNSINLWLLQARQLAQSLPSQSENQQPK